ncbi:rod-determining factor RdfA [Halocatena halophila]|uniref:rod-determining factor RdfA n=1 Tax=Halocatena halophila TaxID=2814576 RepID=UPI002ED64501
MEATTGCKVDRIIAEYGLFDADPQFDSLDDGLLARWRGNAGRTPQGYRPLTDWFNKRLLRTVYTEHGRETLSGRLEAAYETLQSDDPLDTAELIESLAVDGIDGEQLQSDFVSWGTMRTHLTECLDGEKEPQQSSGNWERESVDRARQIVHETVEEAVSSLTGKDVIADGTTAAIDVQIQLRCGSCPTQVPFGVAIERGYICATHGDGGGNRK